MKMKMWICVVILFCISVYAVLPLFGRGYIPTHDGEYHIMRIVEFSKMLGAGYVVPRWAPDLNSGYGIPIFNFHYPFPNYIGSFMRVFTHDAVSAFQISMGLGYILVVFMAFAWLTALFGAVPALVGAITAAFVPYLFVDMYVRGTIGEIWAMVFLFLSLFLIEKKKYVFFAYTFGLLIVSHNILAMVFTPFLFVYGTIRNPKALWSMALGAGLSAFFWLPALIEQKFVVGLNTVNFRQHFVRIYELLIPSWGTGFSGTGEMGNTISFQLGIAPIVAILGALVTPKKSKLFVFFILVFIASVFLMLPVSREIWEGIQLLQLVQYPWRLLSFMVPVTAYMTAYWVSRMNIQWWGVLFAVFAVALSYSYARPVVYEPRNEAYYVSQANFTDGTSSMGNSFSTVWTGWKNERPPASYTIENGRMTQQTRRKYLEKDLTVFMDDAGTVTVNTLYFPGWIAYVDGEKVPIQYMKDGVIHISVPQGEHRVFVHFSGTPVRTAANVLSLASVAVSAVLGYTYGRKRL